MKRTRPTIETFLDTLGPQRREVAELWAALGLARKDFAAFLAAHRDELAAAGVELHTATASQAGKLRSYVELDGRRVASISLPVVTEEAAPAPAGQLAEEHTALVVREQDTLARLVDDRLALAVAAWLDSKLGKTGSTRTRDAYKKTLADFRAALGRAGLDLIDNGDAVALVAQAWARSSKVEGREVKPSTVAQRLACVSSFYAFAIRRGLVRLDAGNPIERVERPRVEPYDGAEAVSSSSLQVMIAALKEAAIRDDLAARDLAILGVMLTTGRRVAEVASLRWRNVELDGQRLTLTFTRAKGGKTMRDTLASDVAAQLLGWLHRHYGAALGDLPADAPLWPSLRSGQPAREPMTTSGIRQMVVRQLDTHPHALRHSFAKGMDSAGAKVSETQARLGHSSLATTGHYLAQLRRQENPYAEGLAGLFGFTEEARG
jgi:site-specific recombinase XerD